MSLAPGTVIGKYVVERKLAEGGMAEIYLCQVRGPEGFSKEVVIKRIRSFLATDAAFVQMFIAEARLASRLNHPNIVQIFDFDRHEDTYYLAMEYVRGQSLWDVRRRAKELMQPMPPPLVAHVGAAVARALHHAHRLTERGQRVGLVHRDVTPHNVLLSYDGAIKLTDFGIAKAGNKLTSPGMLKGKFAYMSPEQARAEEVDARTDLFALGIVLWEMLTGGRLFDGDSDVAVLRAVQQSAIAPPARLNPDVAPELDAAVVRALQRDPAQRFQTAQELERALALYLVSATRRPEDTDVGLYLGQLFREEASASERREPTSIREPVASTPSRPRTAVMRLATPAPAASPDEDFHADTHILDRHERGVAPPQGRGGGVSTAPLEREERTASALKAAPSPAAPLMPAPPSPVETSPLTQEDVASLRRATASRSRWVLGASVLAAITVGALSALAFRAPRSAPVGSAEGQPPLGVEAPPGLAQPAQVPVEGPDLDSGTAPAAAVEAPLAAPEERVPPPSENEAAQGLTTAARSEEAPTVQRAPSRSRRGKREGTVILKVTPWATLFVDGEPQGDVQGSRTLTLPAGRHELRLVHPKGSRTFPIVVREGQTRSVTHDVFSTR